MSATGLEVFDTTVRDKETKGRYEFPYGDFNNVHRCAVISAESRARQYKHYDIEKAAHRLNEIIDAVKPAHAKH